jgi:ABC-type uncharacterized transport system permease subunit
MNNLIPSILSISLYLLSGIFVAVRLFAQQGATSIRKPVIISVATIALLIHSHLLYQGIFNVQGLNLGIFNAFSLVSWLIVLMLIMTAIRKPIENLGIVLFPLAAVAILLEINLPSERIISSGGPWQLRAHIMFSFLAYSLFTIAMVQAIILYIQDKHLRNHQPGGFIRSLPPLQSMEYLLFQIITVGYLLLTIGLLTGGLFLEDIFTKHLAHKTVLSIIAWAIFSVLLWGRFRYGWRGRKAIHWTLGGFITLMLAYFGSKMVLELVLSR